MKGGTGGNYSHRQNLDLSKPTFTLASKNRTNNCTFTSPDQVELEEASVKLATDCAFDPFEEGDLNHTLSSLGLCDWYIREITRIRRCLMSLDRG